MADQQIDAYILQSIRSEDSNSSEQPQPKKQPVQIKKSPMAGLLDDDHELQIRETINFGHNPNSQSKFGKQKQEPQQNEPSRQSADFSAFNDTDQIIMSAKQTKNQPPIDKSQKIKAGKHAEYPEISPYQTNQPAQIIDSSKKLKAPDKKALYLNLDHHEDEEEQIDINVSMIGQRPKAFKQKNMKKQEIKQEKIPQKVQQPVHNPFQSIYLPNLKKIQEKTGINLKVMDNTMYWVYDNKEIKITSQILQALVEQFFKKQIMLPLISDSQFKSEHIAVFMQVYTQFLNDFFSQQFISIFSAIKASSLITTKFQTGTNPLTPKSSQGLIKNLYQNYFPNFLRGSGYSKAQMIRNHMMKKLQLITYLSKIQEQRPQPGRDQILEQKYKQTQYSIAVLELLISFENSENYCQNNSKQGIDHTIWKQHERKINSLRKKWIDKIESIKNDFSFKI